MYVKVQNVSKIYKKGRLEIQALKDVSLEIEKGDFAVIWGVSGSGKTTLLNLIGGLDRPDSGRIIVDSTDLTTLNEDQLSLFRREKVGFVFQFFNLIPTLTSLENVLFPLVPVPLAKEEKIKRAKELLTSLLPAERLHYQLPLELSGGEQQRVAIARALINNPQIILADEPTSDLDTQTGMQIIDLLQEANKKGCTVIIATHDSRLLERANLRVEMEDGKIKGVERVGE